MVYHHMWYKLLHLYFSIYLYLYEQLKWYILLWSEQTNISHGLWGFFSHISPVSQTTSFCAVSPCMSVFKLKHVLYVSNGFYAEPKCLETQVKDARWVSRLGVFYGQKEWDCVLACVRCCWWSLQASCVDRLSEFWLEGCASGAEIIIPLWAALPLCLGASHKIKLILKLMNKWWGFIWTKKVQFRNCWCHYWAFQMHCTVHYPCCNLSHCVAGVGLASASRYSHQYAIKHSWSSLPPAPSLTVFMVHNKQMRRY